MASLADFFKDERGHAVIWQWPKIPLSGWIIFKVLALLFSQGRLKSGFEHLSTAFLFAWAFLEITDGVNYFRKSLGLIVMAIIVLGFFR